MRLTIQKKILSFEGQLLDSCLHTIRQMRLAEIKSSFVGYIFDRLSPFELFLMFKCISNAATSRTVCHHPHLDVAIDSQETRCSLGWNLRGFKLAHVGLWFIQDSTGSTFCKLTFRDDIEGPATIQFDRILYQCMIQFFGPLLDNCLFAIRQIELQSIKTSFVEWFFDHLIRLTRW